MTAQRRVAVSPSVAAGQENGDQLREVGEILRGKRRSRSPPAPARRVVYDRGTLLWKADPLEWKNCCTIDECAAPNVVGHYPRAGKCIADAGGNSAMIKEIAWRSLVEEVMDHDIAGRIAAAPLSEFESQVVSDHPELSVAESRVVANMLLRCAEYAAQVVLRYIADNPGKAINKVSGNPKP